MSEEFISDEEKEALKEEEPKEKLKEKPKEKLKTEELAAKEDIKEEEDEATIALPAVPKFRVDETQVKADKESAKTIDDQIKLLHKRMKNGDIEVDDFVIELGDLQEKKYTIFSKLSKAEAEQSYNNMSAEQLWAHEQKVFMERGENKIFSTNTSAYGALSEVVKDIASKNPDKSGLWVLDNARKQVVKDLNLEKPNVAKKQAPITLSEMPTADKDDVTDKSDFADIDEMIDRGMIKDYESSIATMKPLDLDNFLRGE
jgi:hypothetical protein